MIPVRNLLAVCAASGFLFSSAQASEDLSRDIAAQSLTQALKEFATQTGLQVVYVSAITTSRVSNHAPRGLSPVDALQRMLAGTGLQFEFLNDRTVRVFPQANCALPPACSAPSLGAATPKPESPSRLHPPDPLEDVMVTGARWWMDPGQAAAPVTLLDRRDIERGGENSIGEVMQALPMVTGSPLNTNVNAPGSAEPRGQGLAGDGSVRIFLHDLPTVVLLNGRRLPNTGIGADSSVDLNMLPMSSIERVEVLANGASAAFGADAVGGVVNIVTRRPSRGVVISGTRTITGHGDGEIITGQAAMGFAVLGGTWSFGVDYVGQDGVTMDRRGYSAHPLLIVDGNGTVLPTGLNNMTPDGSFDVPEGNALGLEGGFYTRVPGSSGQTSADFRPYDRAIDGFNPAPFNYSQTPNERGALWLIGSSPLNESTNLFLEAFANHRESAQQSAPAFYRTGFAVPTDVGHPADNYYNPFGVDVPLVYRRLTEAGNRTTDQDVNLWRALVGLEGGTADWSWEVALQGTWSEATEVESGFLSRPHLVAALGPSGPDESGRIVCGSPDPASGHVPAANIIRGCVPLNLFGGAGSITPDQLAYVTSTMINRGTNEQQFAQFVLGGPGGRILERNLQWVLGAEYRRETGSLTPDLKRAAYAGDVQTAAPNTGLLQFMPQVSGDYEAYEFFTALQVPLLHDLPWSRDMALNIGLRWSDFDSFDGHPTWQAGLRWQPAEELTLRTSYGEVYRAPSLAELYERPTVIERFPFDPCGNEPTAAQQANCAANGVPGGAYVQDGSGVEVVQSGNPKLQPETGHTLGVGLVYAPLWAKGLSASVDFLQVNQANDILAPTADDVLYQCAQRGSELCRAISRLPDGQLVGVAANYQNIGKSEVRAFDLAVNWSALTEVGKFTSRLLATYLERWDRQSIPGGDVYSYAGNFASGARPRWRALGHLDWRSGPWLTSYSAEYIGDYSERVDPWPLFGVDFEPFYRRVAPVVYHDIEAGFTFDSGVTLRAVVSNITDEDPPYLNIAPANTDVATYRLLGRSYFLEMRYHLD